MDTNTTGAAEMRRTGVVSSCKITPLDAFHGARSGYPWHSTKNTEIMTKLFTNAILLTYLDLGSIDMKGYGFYMVKFSPSHYKLR